MIYPPTTLFNMNINPSEGKGQIAMVAGSVAECGRGELSRWKLRAGTTVAGSAEAQAQQQAGIGFPNARHLPQQEDRDIEGFQCWCLDFGREVPPPVCGIKATLFTKFTKIGPSSDQLAHGFNCIGLACWLVPSDPADPGKPQGNT